VELDSFSARAKVALVCGYIALVVGAASIGEVTGWWSWDDRFPLFVVAAPYWTVVMIVDAVRGRRSGRQTGSNGAGDVRSVGTADDDLLDPVAAASVPGDTADRMGTKGDPRGPVPPGVILEGGRGLARWHRDGAAGR
jgi:hypothetical protein